MSTRSTIVLAALLMAGLLAVQPVVATGGEGSPASTPSIESNTTAEEAGVEHERIATSSAQTIAKTNTSFPSIELRQLTWRYRNGSGITQVPTVSPSRNISFNGGEDYRIVVHDQRTGGSISVTPPEDMEWTSITSASIYTRNSNGELAAQASIWHSLWDYNLETAVNGDISTSGIVNQSVSVVDAQTGQTLAETDSRPYLIGYNRSVSTTDRGSTLGFTLPAEPFPVDSNVSLSVYDEHTDPINDEEDAEIPMTYSIQQDAFVGELAKDQLSPGNYSYAISVEHHTGLAIDIPQLDLRPGETPAFVIEDDESPNSPPRADLSVTPTTPVPNENLMLDASGSTDTDGSITAFRWDVDGDDDSELTTQSPTHTHAYSGPGTYDIGVTVVDGSGATATTNRTVTVLDLDRFDRNEPTGDIGFQDVLDTIGNFNSGNSIGGQPVTFQNVLSVIDRFNGNSV